MPQVFKPGANSVAKLSLILGGALPVALIFAGSAISRGSNNTGVGIALDQPVPFSHKHHAFELGIDCRFCHTSVEKSGFAGIPQTDTCMTCHSQIWTNSPLLEPVRKSYATGTPIEWTRVNRVPEFVYFNHSIHVARGISCNNCHGKMQDQQITAKGRAFFMIWCLECHREPEKYLYRDETRPDLTPRQQVFNLYMKAQRDPKGTYMSPREQALLFGNEQKTKDAAQIEEGKKLVEKYKVKKAQLADCQVCHR